MTLKTKPYDSARYLRDDKDALLYLDAVLQENDVALLAHALGVLSRYKGMTAIARKTGVSREGLYKALSKDGNPSLATVLSVLSALDLRLRVGKAKSRKSGPARKLAKAA